MAEDPKHVRLTIDGAQVKASKGTTILQAAAELGTEVPHYCYHPGLSSPAMCRLCLVEVEGASKPMPACVTAVADGQVVHTRSPFALEMRRGVLEFYALNHPLDCPICDMSGECYFQDYLHIEGRAHGRFRDAKRVLGRDDFGGDVLFNADRCVMCTRCVRFMTEIEQDTRLAVVERGDRSIIDTFFDRGLEGTHWHGNIVDLCPVGALVSKDFLYKARAWDLDHTDSICPNCSQGCNISLHTRDNLVQRVKPRANIAVNGHWMCDYGRLNYEWMNRVGCLEAPLIRDETGLRVAGWKEALGELLSRLRAMANLEPVALVSPFSSNEDLGALRGLLDHLGGGAAMYRCPEAADEIVLRGFPQLARRRDLAPNSAGADLMGMSRLETQRMDAIAGHGGPILVLGDELVDVRADFGAASSLFVYLGTHAGPGAAHADLVLPITTFAESEGTFTNVQGRVQRFWPALVPRGVARPAWLILGALLAELTSTEVPRSAADSFAWLADRVAAFSGLSYEALGIAGAEVTKEAAHTP